MSFVESRDVLRTDLEGVVATIDEEVRRRRQAVPFVSPWVPRAVPGDLLVELAGHAHLLAPTRTRRLLEHCLWSRVREAVGADAPAQLACGSYEPSLAAVEAALRPAVRRPDARRLPALRLAALKQAKASPLERACVAALRARLNAGLFLAGLETLWGDEGLSAARWLWHEGSLREWDRFLAGRQVAPVLRKVAVAHRALPDPGLLAASPWLRPLVTFVPGSAARAVSRNPLAAERLERRLLVDDLLRRHVESEAGADWTVSTPEGMPDPWVIVRGAGGAMVAAWIGSSQEEPVRLAEEWALLLDGVVLAERIELDAGDPGAEDGEALPTIALLRLVGGVDAGSLARAPRELGLVHLARAAFPDGPDSAARMLAEAIGPMPSPPR